MELAVRAGVGGLLLVLSATAWAQSNLTDPCGCNAGLVPNSTVYSASSRVNLAYMHQIDKSQYEVLKRNGRAKGALGDLLSASSSYEQFEEKRSKYLEREQYTLSSDQSVSLVMTTFATGDWSACKRECIRSRDGFQCDISNATRTNATLTCAWRIEGTATARDVSIEIDGVGVQAASIPPNTSQDWTYPRDSRRDLLFTAKLQNGSSRTVALKAIPPETTIPPRNLIKDAMAKGLVCTVVLSDGIGTLYKDKTYYIQYLSDHFVTTGPQAPKGGTLTNHSGGKTLESGVISMFGALLAFAPDGQLTNATKGTSAGKISCPS